MPDIEPAAFAGRADQRRRHLHLVEGLIPDVVEPVRLRHPRPDAGIDEVEEEQSGDALRRRSAPAAASARRRHRGRRYRPASAPSASISASMSAACWSGPNSPSGLSLSPKPRRSGAIQREAIGEPRHHRLPGQPEFRPAMQQQQRLARHPSAPRGTPRHWPEPSNAPFSAPFRFAGCRHGFLAPRLVWPAILA